MSVGRIIFANLSDPSGFTLMSLLLNTPKADVFIPSKSNSFVVDLNALYAGQFSSSLAWYSSILLARSSPSSWSGCSVIFMLSIGAPSELIISSVFVQYSPTYGLFLILSFSSGVSHVAVVCMFSLALFTSSHTFFDSQGNGVIPSGLTDPPFQIVCSGLCVSSRYVPAHLASFHHCDSLTPIASSPAL